MASIKPALEMRRAPGTPLGVRLDRSQASFGGMSLSALISYACGVKLAQISGPEWLRTQRFDIVAKLPEGGSTERVAFGSKSSGLGVTTTGLRSPSTVSRCC